MQLYIRSFWRALSQIFTLDFWRVNKMLRKRHLGCLYTYEKELYEIKKWAKAKGYHWDNTWYLDGEKYLYRNGVAVCMIQPYQSKVFTRYKAHQPNYTDKLVEDKTFLLNHNKTAKALFECLNKEREYLFDRDRLCEKINNKLSDKQYVNSNEFLSDLSELSFGNYYDILDLKHNTNLTTKEKKEYIGDYCDYDKLNFSYWLSFEDAEEKEKAGEDFEWNWTADFVPTALTRGAIDSVLCINPDKIRGLKVTPELLRRMHDLYFQGL